MGRTQSSSHRRLFLHGACLFLILVVLGAPMRAQALTEKGFEALHTFSKVLHYVEENYADEIDEDELIQGAMQGMLGTLDPHSVYMSPEIYRELKVDTRGRFDGIGIEVTVRKGYLTVVSPIKGSPAAREGIQAGDVILRIDGKGTKNMMLSQAVSLMRGKRGSRITLTIGREGHKPFDVSLKRSIIKVPSVKAEVVGDRFGYVSISNFQQGTGRALRRALKQLRKENALDGLILDLRHNPGGLLDQAVVVSDLFMDEGVIVTTASRGREIDRHEAHAEETEPDYPVVVLIDRGSASASEIVAGALQDSKRATIMGTTSFGKGSVQTVIDLDDGSGLKLTIAKYQTPSGRFIQDLGVVPDIVVPKDQPKPKASAKKGVAKAAPSASVDEGEEVAPKPPVQKEGEDYQLKRAIEFLQKATVSSAQQQPVSQP